LQTASLTARQREVARKEIGRVEDLRTQPLLALLRLRVGASGGRKTVGGQARQDLRALVRAEVHDAPGSKVSEVVLQFLPRWLEPRGTGLSLAEHEGIGILG